MMIYLLCVNISVAPSPLSLTNVSTKLQSEFRPRPAASSSHRQTSAETCCRGEPEREREILIAIIIKKCFNIQHTYLPTSLLGRSMFE